MTANSSPIPAAQIATGPAHPAPRSTAYVRRMRAAYVVIAIAACAACGSDKTPAPAPAASAAQAGEPPANAASPVPLAGTGSASASTVSAAIAATTGPLGRLATGPLPATPAQVRKRGCGPASPVDLGSAEGGSVAAAFGATSGIVAWSASETRLAIRELDRTGQPRGPVHELVVPARVSPAYGVRALDGHFLIFLAATDFTGPSPIAKLYAVLTDAHGVPDPGVLRVAIGDRGMIDAVSPSAAHGVLVWAGPTPATHVTQGRLISVVVDDRGTLAQSVLDIPDPAPGDRAQAFFSFGDHAVTVIGTRALIVDGELRAQQRTFEPDGLEVAPTFTGASVPVLGLALGKDARTMRYGTLALDGAMTFGKEVAKSAPLRPPFEERVDWMVSTGASGTQVLGVTEPTGKPFGAAIAVPPAIASGIATQVVWSGEQVLVLAADGHTVRVAPLPCP